MKDKHARALAIVALVFMIIFVAALVAALADATLFNGGIGYVALSAGVFVLVSLLALKADGRGFSLTKMKNESELKKIEQELKEQEERDGAESAEEDRSANGESESDPDPEKSSDEKNAH